MPFLHSVGSLRGCTASTASRLRSHSQSSSSSAASSPWPAGVLQTLVAVGFVAVSSRKAARAAVVPAPLPKEAFSLSHDEPVDLVLSSGFLSFANHTGFLKAVQEAGLEVRGIMGTSAGALSGSLYAAGYTPAQIADELSKNSPSHYLALSQKPWEGGVLNMEKAIARYRELLPATFEELDRDFAVGVWTRDGEYVVIDSGPLPEAVVASAAIPVVFEHVRVPGYGPCMDGGKYDRVGLEGWQARCARAGLEPRKTLVHLIERSSPFSGKDDLSERAGVAVVRSPKSGVSLQSLGDFDNQFSASFARASTSISHQISKQGKAAAP